MKIPKNLKEDMLGDKSYLNHHPILITRKEQVWDDFERMLKSNEGKLSMSSAECAIAFVFYTFGIIMTLDPQSSFNRGKND